MARSMGWMALAGVALGLAGFTAAQGEEVKVGQHSYLFSNPSGMDLPYLLYL